MIGQRLRAWGIVPTLLLLVGCGGEAQTDVSGKITHAGKPISSGLINFQLANGPVFGGPIDADGAYEYSMPPGEYLVRIDAPGVMPQYIEGQPEPKPVPREAPAKYASYATSGLTATVTDGSSQTIDFALP